MSKEVNIIRHLINQKEILVIVVGDQLKLME